MKLRPIAATLLGAIAAGVIACTPTIDRACDVPRAAPARPREAEFVVVGDTQRTFWAEPREQNESERRALVAAMASEHPSELLHLGDMVVYGALDSEWRYFDALVSPLTCAGVPIHPVLGNHDYWGEDWGEPALAHARERFPELSKNTFYLLRRGPLALVFLDSNLSGRSATVQRDWLELMLRGVDCDRDIRAVIAFTHHPAYTLGVHRASDPYVRGALLPVLEKSPKFVLMMSGHVHGYERFELAGRTFVVSGGGGGPRVEYRTQAEAEPRPAFPAAQTHTEKRPFNYAVLRANAESLELTVRCLPGGLCPESRVLDHDVIAFPDPQACPTRSNR